jgi:transcriptional regulator with XRE-family HTH domain
MKKESVIIWDAGQIKSARTVAGYTAEQAAELLSITPEYLSMLENGKRQPSPRILNRISTLYRRPAAYFLVPEKNFAEA